MTTKVQSQWSATMIGHQPTTDRNAMSKKVFSEESRQVSTFLQGVHHSRKISHQQVNYASTVQKLSKLQENTPVYLQKETIKDYGAETNPAIKKHNELATEYIVKERYMNDRKRLYNREVGRTAVVDKILTGTAPMPHPYLYPQKATHVQILAMTGKLKAPDASIIPPVVPRTKKWLGDGEGWEGSVM